jgi:glycosyltransferase involved in cell wall biosynthesis|tara:strand:+ start:374 stop:1120 length:747 start_codon:yes stop_codon:yes gene_type:complete
VPKPNLSIILPTYNERDNIKILIPGIEKTFGHINHEIIVVDDSSPDGTAKASEELNKKYGNIRVIVRKKKEGIGAAIREGYNSAKNPIILSSDSDLSFTLSDTYRLYEKIQEGYDLVWGSKYSRGSFYEPETLGLRVKKRISKYGNRIIGITTGIKAKDFTANLRVIKKDVWEQIDIQENTNTFLMEMILKCKYGGLRVTEMPVTFNARVYGKSKMNLGVEAPKFIIKMVKYVLMYRFTGYKLNNKEV